MLKFTVKSPFNRLPEMRKRLGPGSDKIAEQCAEDIVSIAKSLVRVRTGALRDSIRARKTRAGNIVVEATQPYAIHIEYGTRHFSAKPFLGPAAEMVRPIFEERMKKLLEP
jgi:HK97 gp10 family phage protein